jgi:hypothetical protein
MKIIHTFTVILIALIVFTSCNFKNKTNQINRNLIDDKDVSVLKIDDDKKVIVRKDYYGTYSFKSWNAYNVANTQIHQVEDLDFNSSVKRIVNLKENISNLSTTIPVWLESNLILKEIRDVQKEYAILLKESNKSTNIIRQNWESLSEEFKDLRKELKETVKDYEIHELK